MITSYAETTDPVEAERTVKASLLLPADARVMKSLEPLAKVAADSLGREDDVVADTTGMAAWRCISLALMAYRQGYSPTAKEWCRLCLSYQGDTPPRVATAHVIRAMSCHQLREVNESRSELALGRQLIDRQFAGGLKSGGGGDGFWFAR